MERGARRQGAPATRFKGLGKTSKSFEAGRDATLQGTWQGGEGDTDVPLCTMSTELAFEANLGNPRSRSFMTTPSGKIIPPRERKIALLGSRSVGKSTLLYLCPSLRLQTWWRNRSLDERNNCGWNAPTRGKRARCSHALDGRRATTPSTGMGSHRPVEPTLASYATLLAVVPKGHFELLSAWPAITSSGGEGRCRRLRYSCSQHRVGRAAVGSGQTATRHPISLGQDFLRRPRPRTQNPSRHFARSELRPGATEEPTLKGDLTPCSK